MMEAIPVDTSNSDAAYRHKLCRELERGNILLLNPTPFLPLIDDCAFLRAQRQTNRASHKNIAYKPHLQRTTGTDALGETDALRLQGVLAAYSQGALRTLGELFPAYAKHWKVDYASFRPVEEQGRDIPLRHRNDLLHLDAFPTRPTHGGRILRAFTNINDLQDRVWAIADPFEELATRYAVAAGLDRVTKPMAAMRRRAEKLVRFVGLRAVDRSAYDQFMLGFHHYLKSDADFQRAGRRQTFAFPPGTTWITFTDQVAHAVLSGQYALEQTCIVPQHAMAQPELAPVAILERLAGKSLTPAPRVGVPTAR